MDLGRAASTLGSRKLLDVKSLLSDLVTELTSQKEGSQEHDALLAESIQQIRHHQFADPEPKKVARQFEDLGDRMESLAQYVKQQHLQVLSRECMTIQPSDESDASELGARILTMLYYTSDRPLHAEHTPSNLVESLLQSVCKEDQERLLAEELRGEFARDVPQDSYSSSDLSEWSVDNASSCDSLDSPDADKENLHQRAQMHALSPGAVDEVGEGQEDEWYGEVAVDSLADFLWHCNTCQTATEQPQEMTTGTALNTLLTRQNKSRDGSSEVTCVNDKTVIDEAVAALRGCKINGSALSWDAGDRRFFPVPSVCTRDLSESLLANLLSQLAESGTNAVRLWDSLNLRAETPSPTHMGFRSAIAAEMHTISSMILGLEESLRRAAYKRPIIHFIAQQKLISRRLKTLCIALSALPSPESPETNEVPGLSSCSLLNNLCKLFQLTSIHSYSSGKMDSSIFARLLIGAFKPTLSAIDDWLDFGRLPSHHADFFIMPGHAEKSMESVQKLELGLQKFWQEAYMLKVTPSGAQPLCPTILQPIAKRLLAAGKSNIMLRHTRRRQEIKKSPTSTLSHQGQRSSKGCLAQLSLAISDYTQDESSGVEAAHANDSAFLETSNIPIRDRMKQSNVTNNIHRQSQPECLAAGPLRKQASEQSHPLRLKAELLAEWGDAEPSTLHAEPKVYEIDPNQADLLPQFEKPQGESKAWEGDREMTAWMTKVQSAMSRQQKDTSARALDPYNAFSTELPVFTGNVDRMLWGGSSPAEEAERASELKRLPKNGSAMQRQTLVAEILLEEHLLKPLTLRVLEIEQAVLTHMRERGNLAKQLEVLKALYLCDLSPMHAFNRELVENLAAPTPLIEIDLPELFVTLECFNQSEEAVRILPGLADLSDAVAIDVNLREKLLRRCGEAEMRRRGREDKSLLGDAAGSKPTPGPRTLEELRAVNVRPSIQWPLLLIVDAESFRLYNQIYTYLLQLKWGQSIVAKTKGLLGNHLHSDKLLTAVMLTHMLSSIENFTTSSLSSLWNDFLQIQKSASSLREVQRAHADFLAEAAGLCMASMDKSWLMIYRVTKKLLDYCLDFQDLTQALLGQEQIAGGVEKQFKQLKDDVRDRHRFLLRALTNKSLKIGSKSGLQDLVMLLDFNGFYSMAES